MGRIPESEATPEQRDDFLYALTTAMRTLNAAYRALLKRRDDIDEDSHLIDMLISENRAEYLKLETQLRIFLGPQDSSLVPPSPAEIHSIEQALADLDDLIARRQRVVDIAQAAVDVANNWNDTQRS